MFLIYLLNSLKEQFEILFISKNFTEKVDQIIDGQGNGSMTSGKKCQ